MAHILIAYASREGQTEKIAHRVADLLTQEGDRTTVVNVAEGPAADVSKADAFIVAGSLHLAKHDPALEAFVRKNLHTLNRLPSCFLSVSLSAASDDPAERGDAWRCLKEFTAATGWTPTATDIVAGGVHDVKTGFFKRIMLHRILRKKGVALDPSGDTEFTDWQALYKAVRKFREKNPWPDEV